LSPYGRALWNRAKAHSAEKDYTSAIADYDRAIQLDRPSAPLFYGRGIAKRRLGDVTGADADLESARQLDPNVERHYADWEVTP
jgi:Flp pilus assembly protein TadD